MTGYGKASEVLNNQKISIEIKSLNSKGADINLRLPSIFRSYELQIRNVLSSQLERGKIDFSITIEQNSDNAQLELNETLIKNYVLQLKKLGASLEQKTDNILELALKMPDVFQSEKIEPSEEQNFFLMQLIQKAITAINIFRNDEGEILKKDFEIRIKNILNFLTKITEIDPQRVEAIRTKIKNGLLEIETKHNVDENRFEQEMIYYIEKLDITEEKVRLNSHLNYFSQTMNDENSGRKLSFIAQEIGREINTIGSKANNYEIQKLVVLMKDELEKIKEQCNNIL
ncbi:MAG: YicC family protein [Bacteroidetes bacterium]|nr:YicC family protein [Bacteroidota bacterium]